MKLAKHLVPSDDSTDAELLVLYDYSCEQAEVPVLRSVRRASRRC